MLDVEHQNKQTVTNDPKQALVRVNEARVTRAECRATKIVTPPTTVEQS